LTKHSKYISNLPQTIFPHIPITISDAIHKYRIPPTKEDLKTWICIICKETQNEDGRCCNLMNNICPKCYFGQKEESKFVKGDRLQDQ